VRSLSQRAGDNYRFAHGPVREAALSAPTVIVSGTIAATPGQGGATWAVLLYLPGLRRHDRDYLNCLLRSQELTAVCLLSLHNLTITRSVGVRRAVFARKSRRRR